MLRVLSLVPLALASCQSVDERSESWSYVHAAIIQPACATAGCHSKLTAIAGIDLSTRTGAYTMLTGRICEEPYDGELQPPPRSYVTPGSPEYSTLMYQLRGESGDGQPYRDIMPPDLPLPPLEVELVARWIAGGAECD